jgi:hypothetical protein
VNVRFGFKYISSLDHSLSAISVTAVKGLSIFVIAGSIPLHCLFSVMVEVLR